MNVIFGFDMLRGAVTMNLGIAGSNPGGAIYSPTLRNNCYGTLEAVAERDKSKLWETLSQSIKK